MTEAIARGGPWRGRRPGTNSERVVRGAAEHCFFSILSVFVPGKVLHERFVSISDVLFLLLDPPLCGPGTLTRQTMVVDNRWVSVAWDGVRGPIWRKTSVTNVWGRSPHTFFTFVLRNLGHQTPSGFSVCAILMFLVCFIFVPADLREWTSLGTTHGCGDPLRIQVLCSFSASSADLGQRTWKTLNVFFASQPFILFSIFHRYSLPPRPSTNDFLVFWSI